MSAGSYSHAVKLYNARCYAAYPEANTMSSSGNPTAPPSALSDDSRLPLNPTSRVTTDGSVVHSSDPTTNSQASPAQKLKGDVAGAVKGTVGSLQGAAGTMLRNKDLEEKGLEKMQEEDQRLAAKRGLMPVGSGQRLTKEEEQR